MKWRLGPRMQGNAQHGRLELLGGVLLGHQWRPGREWNQSWEQEGAENGHLWMHLPPPKTPHIYWRKVLNLSTWSRMEPQSNLFGHLGKRWPRRPNGIFKVHHELGTRNFMWEYHRTWLLMFPNWIDHPGFLSPCGSNHLCLTWQCPRWTQPLLIHQSSAPQDKYSSDTGPSSLCPGQTPWGLSSQTSGE